MSSFGLTFAYIYVIIYFRRMQYLNKNDKSDCACGEEEERPRQDHGYGQECFQEALVGHTAGSAREREDLLIRPGRNDGRLVGKGWRKKQGHVVYAIVDCGCPLYIGFTGDPAERLTVHRRRFGDHVEMHVIEDSLCIGDARASERRWIHYFAQVETSLCNISRPNPNPPNDKITISVRNIPSDLWGEISRIAESMGWNIGYIFTQALRAWVENYKKEGRIN